MHTQLADSTAGAVIRGVFFAFIVALVLAMWPWTTDPTQHIKILLLHTSAAALAIALLTGAWKSGTALDRPALFLVPVAALLAWNALSAALSNYPYYGLEEVARLASLTVVFYAASQVFRRPGHVHGLLLAMIAGVAVSSLYAFLQWLDLDPFPWANTDSEEYLRLPGTFGNPNVAGHAMVITILACVYLVTTNPRRHFWLVIPFAAFGAHLMYTRHRGGVVALAFAVLVGLGVYALSRKPGKPRTRALHTTAIAAATAALLVVCGVGYAVVQQGRTVPLDSSLLLRFNGFYNAARMAADAPLLGAGPNAYVIDTPAYWTEYEQRWFDTMHMMNRHVHNDFLEAAVETGIPGTAFYAALLLVGFLAGAAMTVRSANDTRRLGVFYAAFFAAFAVDGMFGFNARVPVTGFFLFALAGSLEGTFALPRRAAAPVWPTRIALLAAALVLVVFSQRLFASERAFYRAEALLEAEHYEDAAETYQRAANYAPWRWRTIRGMGISRYYQKDYESAIRHFERSIANNPNWVMTMVPLIHSHIAHAGEFPRDSEAAKRREHLERALELAARARALAPEMTAIAELEGRAAFALASMGLQEGDSSLEPWEEARAGLERALDLGVETTPSLLNMVAEARLKTGDENGARAALLQSVHEFPHDDAAWAALVGLGTRLNDPGLPLSALNDAIAAANSNGVTDPEVLGALFLWRGTALSMNPETLSSSYQDFERAVALAPGSPAVWSRYAAAASNGNALDRFQASAAKAGDGAPAAVQLAAAYWSGRHDTQTASIRLLDAMLQNALPAEVSSLPEQFGWFADTLLEAMTQDDGTFRDEPDTLLTLGKVYAAMGVLEPAEELFGAAFAGLRGEKQAESFRMWIGTLRSMGREAEANAMIREVQQQQRMRQTPTPESLINGQ